MSHELELPRLSPPYIFPTSSGHTTYDDLHAHKYPAKARAIVFDCADIPGLECGDSLTLRGKDDGKTAFGQITMLHRAGEGRVHIKRGECMIAMYLEKAISFESADSDKGKDKEDNNGN